LDTLVYVHTHSPPSLATIIGIPTYQTPDIYTVAFKDGSLSEYSEDLLSLAPVPSSSQTISLLPPWLKGGTKATLFLHDMTKPRHGTLQLLSDNIWTFYPGKSTTGIPLPDLQANCQHLLDTGQLFRSHAKFKNVYAAISQESLRDCVLRHVSAHGLWSLIAPTSLKHHSKMDPEDKLIWDSTYDEEYGVLVRVLSWQDLCIMRPSQPDSLTNGSCKRFLSDVRPFGIFKKRWSLHVNSPTNDVVIIKLLSA
jgi:hypothetical protein